MQVLIYAFTDFKLSKGTMSFNGIDNYLYLFTDDKFYKAFRNTLVFAFSKITIDTVLSLSIALILNSRIPARKFFRGVYFAPVVVPVVASSLIWIWFFDPSIGPFNQVLAFCGHDGIDWIYHEDTALMSIVLFSIWKGLGYNIMLFLAGLQNIPRSCLEAASVDGATSIQILFRIKLPLLRPVISFVLMMGLINTFKVFAEVDVMTPKGGPLYSTALMVNYIYEQSFTNGRMGRGCAASLILFMVIFLLTFIQGKLGARKTIEME